MSTPRPPVANVAKIEALGIVQGGVNVAQVFYGRYNDPAPLSGGNATAIANEFEAIWATEFQPLLTVNYDNTLIRLTDLHTTTGVQVSVAGFGAGTNAGTPLPSSSALVVKQSTALRGRSFRGRTYFCGLGENELLSPSLWTNGAVVSFQSAMDNVIAAMDTGAHIWTMGIVSYFGPPTVLAGSIAPGNPKRSHSTLRAAPIFNPVTSSAAEAQVRTQRRRLGGR